MEWIDTKPEHLPDAVLDAKIMGGEDIDDTWPEIRQRVMKEIGRAQADIRSCLQHDDSGRVIVHRYIDAEASSFDPAIGLGECWSFDRSGAYGYAARNPQGGLVITAAVSFDDLVGPVCLAFWESGETEARLDVRCKVEILAIHLANRPVHEDLTGHLADVAQTSLAWRPRL